MHNKRCDTQGIIITSYLVFTENLYYSPPYYASAYNDLYNFKLYNILNMSEITHLHPYIYYVTFLNLNH